MDENENREVIPAEDPGTSADDFEPILSQADFDERIKKRLNRQREKLERDFEERLKAAQDGATSDELESLRSKAAEQDELLQAAAKENEELKAAKAAADLRDLKLYNAQRYGVPLELLDNITGETPDEIEKSAEKLGTFTSRALYAQIPSYNPEPGGYEYRARRSNDMAMREMLRDLDDGAGGLF